MSNDDIRFLLDSYWIIDKRTDLMHYLTVPERKALYMAMKNKKGLTEEYVEEVCKQTIYNRH